MTSTFLLALWAGGGNVPPQLGLARQLAVAGNRVRVLAPAALQQRIEAAGLEFEPYRNTPEHDESDPARSVIRDFELRSPIAAAKAQRDRLLGDFAEPVAKDILAILERDPADTVVFDFMLLGALFAAEKADIPAAMLVHTIYPFPAPGLPPFGNGWSPRSGRLGSARDKLGAVAFQRVWLNPLTTRLNEVRDRLGLRPSSFEDMLNAVPRILVLTSGSFDFPARLPANVRYVGPHLEPVDETAPWEAPWPAGDTRPLVVVSLSTTYQGQETLVRNTVEAVGQLPVRALITAGPVQVPGGQVPPNVHVARFVPHASVLPHAAAVVTHAGHGTVMAALRHGLPLVCLPMGRDQGDIAARVAWHGAGVRLSARSNAAKIGTRIEQVLRDPAFTTAAQRLAATIAETEAAGTGVNELVGLATRRLGPHVVSDDGRVA
ncbi:MAG TPA: glycosyltransferase [Jiangellaceae bacterium]